MVGSLSAGLLLADEAGAHLPSVDDFLPPEILFQGTPFAINRIILIRVVATIVLLVVLGVTAKRAKLIPGRWQGVVEYGLDFVRDKVVYDVMGEARGKRYVPMITTLFFTIFIFNLCGIIPGMNMAANATVVMPLVFAVWTLIQYWIAAGRWVYEGQLRADTVRHGVIPDRSNHQERHEILRVESFDGDVKAVQSFLNEHDAGYIAEVTPEQPIIVEALGNKACVYVTKIVQCELRDGLRLLEAK